MPTEAESIAVAVAPSRAPGRAAHGFRSYIRAHPQVVTVPGWFVLFVAAWEGALAWLEVPAYLLPAPSQVADALVGNLDRYAIGFQVTFTEIVVGFAIGAVTGIVLGALMAQVPLLEATFYPYLVAFKAIPLLAIAPLFIIWFGFGITSKIVITALVVFFPVMVNTMMGMKSAEPKQIAILRSVGASGFQVFRMVKVPSALPHIFTGLEVSVVFAPIGAIVGEFVGAQQGLGYQVLQAQSALDTDRVFAIILILAAIGIGLYLLTRLARRRIVFWAP